MKSVILQTSLFSAVLTLCLGALAPNSVTVTIPFMSASEGASTAKPNTPAPITPLQGAASLSQPVDLGVSISAADTPLAAGPGAALLPTTATEQQSSSAKKRAKQRRRAKRNTSYFFIQHYIDFAFRCSRSQHCNRHRNPLIEQQLSCCCK